MNLVKASIFLAYLLGSPPASVFGAPLSGTPAAPDPKLARSINTFGINLLGELLKFSKNENVLISPFSLSSALSMAHFGTAQETLTAMRKALGFSDLKEEMVSKGFRNACLGLARRSPMIQLELANSIWIRQNFEVRQSFVDLNEKVFSARASRLDFGDPKSVEIINQWVSDKTHRMIPTIIDEKILDSDVVTILINTLYFHGKWAKPFDKNRTAAGIFVLDDGQKKLVQMMNLTGDGLRIHHLKTDLFEAVALPYGKDEFRMAVLLPNGNKKVDEVLSGFSATSWETWAARFSRQEGQVTMPRFKMEYKREDLTKELSSLGMSIAFGDRANFSRMSPDSHGLFISKVLHKTQIEVDEEGTKASAANLRLYVPDHARMELPFR